MKQTVTRLVGALVVGLVLGVVSALPARAEHPCEGCCKWTVECGAVETNRCCLVPSIPCGPDCAGYCFEKTPSHPDPCGELLQ